MNKIQKLLECGNEKPYLDLEELKNRIDFKKHYESGRFPKNC